MGKKKEDPIRVVLDTNILISALLFKGELSKILFLWKAGIIIPIFTKETFDEFRTVLNYPKFSLTEEEIKAIIEEEVLPYFEVIDVKEALTDLCNDPDDKFISCAMSAPANFIVTSDKEFGSFKQYRGIQIIKASELIKQYDIELNAIRIHSIHSK